MAVANVALAATPTKIKDDYRVDELGTSIMDGWAAWHANTSQRPRTFSGYVQPDGGEPRRIPQRGDVSIGNLIEDGPRAGEVVFTAWGAHERRHPLV